MRVSIQYNDQDTQILLAPECDVDKQAIQLLVILNGAGLTRRIVKSANTAEKKTCLLIRLEEAKREAEPTMFDPETNAELPRN